MIRVLPTLLVLALVLAGCAQVFPLGPTEVVDEATDQNFTLVLRAPADRYAPGQPIEVVAELVYDGPKNRETVYHASSPVGWRIVQLDGDAVMGGGMDMPCLTTDLTMGRPQQYPFEKAGVVEDRGPFDAAWFRDRALTLPAGRWRVVASMNVALGDCGGENHALEAAIDLVVGG